MRGGSGIGPALAGKLGGGSAISLRAGFFVDRFQCSLRPDPAPLYFLGSAGPGLRAQVSFGQDGAFALCAREGFDRFQCSLRTDPAPLRFYGAMRDRSCARREALERIGFRAVREGRGDRGFFVIFSGF